MPFSFDTSYKELDSELYSTVSPATIETPEILLLNEPLCDDLGIDASELTRAILSGQDRLEEPIAQAYAGHQFGRFTILGERQDVLGTDLVSPAIDPSGRWGIEIALDRDGLPPKIVSLLGDAEMTIRDVGPRQSWWHCTAVV